MTACLIEALPSISFIEKDLAAGLTAEAIGGKYQIDAAAVKTHMQTCLADPTPKSVVAKLNIASRHMERLLEKAIRDGDKDAAFKATAQIRALQVDIGKSMGMFQTDAPTIDARQIHITALADMSVEDLKALAALRKAG